MYPGFTALDFIGPYEVLRRLPDAEVRFVWHEPGPITADSGVLVIGATHSFAETPSPDVILVPGGMTTVEHARDERLLDWLRSAHRDRDAGRRRCARGRSSWPRPACSTANAPPRIGPRCSMLKALGVNAVGDERVVHEGNIVTSAGVSAGIDLALWLAGQIGGEDRAKVIQLSIEYDPQPPFDSGHMSKASAKTKASATASLAREIATPAQLKAGSQLLWNRALSAARGKARR